MQEDIENQHPNKRQGLAESIRNSINKQLDQSVRKALCHESLLKVSIDKDLENLFPQVNQVKTTLTTNTHIQEVASEIKAICQWLESSQQFSGMAYIPYFQTSRLLQVLHQKIENTIIVVTQYLYYWVEMMMEMGRLSHLEWGALSASLDIEDKVRVLELYELKKLKILFITPSFFHAEDFHQFQSDLLLVLDLHLYLRTPELIDKIIQKTSPTKAIGLYHTLLKANFVHFGSNSFQRIIEPNSNNHELLVLKSASHDKFRNLMTYISKYQFGKTLIVINRKSEAFELSKKLLMQSKSSCNLLQCLTSRELNSYTSPQILHRTDKEEQRIFDVLRRNAHCEIFIGSSSDFLKFGNFNLVVFYSFADVVKFVQTCPTSDNRLMMFSEEDYFTLRNRITAELLMIDSLNYVVMKVVEKARKKLDENSKKRFYSDHIDDRILDCYSTCKQLAQKDQQKAIRVNTFCRNHEITHRVFTRIITALNKSHVISSSPKIACEIEINQQSLQKFRLKFPNFYEIKGKVNVLNVSTLKKITTKSVLESFRKEQITFKVSEQAIQIRVLKNFQEINWAQLHHTVNQPILQAARSLDLSFNTYKNCAYSSVELTRREKTLQRKEELLGFSPEGKVVEQRVKQNYHKSNLLSSQIEQWIKHCEQLSFDEHGLVLVLQGVESSKTANFRQQPIFGRYQKLRYEELMEITNRIMSNKKVKLL